MTPKRERIIFLANRIGTIRSELQTLESELDDLLSTDVKGRGGQGKNGASSTGKLMSGSLGDRLVKRMRAEPHRSFRADELMEVAEGANISAVRSGLIRLVNSKYLTKVKRGLYRIKPVPGGASTA